MASSAKTPGLPGGAGNELNKNDMSTMMTFSTHTTDTFTTTDGKTVRCEEILVGAAKSVLCNGIKRGMTREDMEDTFQDACYKAWKIPRVLQPRVLLTGDLREPNRRQLRQGQA